MDYENRQRSALRVRQSAFTTARAEPSLVIVVRHAERAPEPRGDPSLSAAGNQRAQLLADTLADAKDRKSTRLNSSHG